MSLKPIKYRFNPYQYSYTIMVNFPSYRLGKKTFTKGIISFFVFFFVGKLIHVEQSMRRRGRQRARPPLVVIMLFLVNKTIVNINQIGLTGLAHYWLLDCRLWCWCCLWWLNWIQRLNLSPLKRKQSALKQVFDFVNKIRAWFGVVYF